MATLAAETRRPAAENLARIALLLAVFAGFWSYHFLNVARYPLHDMTLPLDWLIPLIPAFGIPYLLYLPYLFFTATYGIILSSEWKRVGVSMLLVQTVAGIVYLVYQTRAPRPMIPDQATFAFLLRFIYAHDAPYNTFPSLHTAHSLVCLFWWRKLDIRWFRAALLLTILILLSTVFLKQHAILDVGGGAFLAVGAVFGAERLVPRNKPMPSLYDL